MLAKSLECFALGFLVQLRQSGNNSRSSQNKAAVCLLPLLSGALINSECIKCPPNYFAATFGAGFFLCCVWPPITQHGWQSPQRFHAASLYNRTEFHPVCRQLGLQTCCSIRLLCSLGVGCFCFWSSARSILK